MCWNASILFTQYHLVGFFSNWLEERRRLAEEEVGGGGAAQTRKEAGPWALP